MSFCTAARVSATDIHIPLKIAYQKPRALYSGISWGVVCVCVIYFCFIVYTKIQNVNYLAYYQKKLVC